MAQCAGITAGSLYDCDDPIQPGVLQTVQMGNLKDIESTTFDVTFPYLLTGITMKTTKAMFLFEGVRNSTIPSYEFVPQAAGNGWNHIVSFSIFEIDSVQKQNIEAMASTEQFAIIQNSLDSGNGDNFFEVYGLGRGLVPLTIVRAPAATDTQGAFQLEFNSGDQAIESKTPSTFFDTDLATTQAAVLALLTPAI